MDVESAGDGCGDGCCTGAWEDGHRNLCAFCGVQACAGGKVQRELRGLRMRKAQARHGSETETGEWPKV